MAKKMPRNNSVYLYHATFRYKITETIVIYNFFLCMLVFCVC